MESIQDLESEATSTPTPSQHGSDASRQLDYHLAALRKALAEPGEHRLYRAGKLAGLFPVRAGVCIAAALDALAENHLETVRTEAKGRQLTEWVRITPAGVEFVHKHDSPQAVLRELQDLIGTTRAGVPLWMHSATEEATRLVREFQTQATAILARLDQLQTRVEAALLRLDVEGIASTGSLGSFVTPEIVPAEIRNSSTREQLWLRGAVSYLDRRREAGAKTPCNLRELFQAATRYEPELTLAEFHTGLIHLATRRAIQLGRTNFATEQQSEHEDLEYALFYENELFTHVMR